MDNGNTKTSCALVLGGGGVTGIAWMTGILLSLQKKGLDIGIFDHIIGTSAGSAVGAQISSETSLEDLYQCQIDPEKQVAELAPNVRPMSLIFNFLPSLLAWRKPEKFRQKIGKMALRAKTIPVSERRNVIKARLPSHNWPNLKLNLIAVDAASGKPVCFDKYSQVDLVDAVAASCAVPGIWPTVRINNCDYIDGGIRSTENADYAKGAKFVLILSPTGDKKLSLPGNNLDQEINILKSNGSRVVLIKPDSESKKLMGPNPLDPAKRAASAIAGLRQGEKEADKVIVELKIHNPKNSAIEEKGAFR